MWVAATADAAGTWLLVMAVPAHVYAVTGSPASTALALAVEAAPAVVIGPWAGALVDRWPRRRVLAGGNLVAAFGVCLLLLAATGDRVGFVYVALAVESAAVCFLRPALQATIAAVARSSEGRAALNSSLAVSHSVLRLCAPPAGTALVAAGWFGAVVVADAVSYLAAAAILAGLPIPTIARSASGAVSTPAPGTAPVSAVETGAGAATVSRDFSGEWRAGWRLVLRGRVLGGLLASSCLYWIANAGLTALLVPFAVHRLHASGEAVGYLVTGLGAGYLCGAAVSGAALVRFGPRGLIALCYAVVGACFLVIFTAESLLVAVVAIAVAGVPGSVANVATTHHVQGAAPPEARGRVSAVFMTSDAVAAVLGALAATAMVAAAGLPATLIGFSCLVPVAAAIALILLPRLG
ncbi:hypothetical protein Ade02nite_78930 [Paractinoplanes deccanensis]|uniref:Major facilitator superfamily (MFS) profile domain-containing protein n=1 Tax=Paractinoplanes deccanensis TaxID=113561 RepID=A0ABQ3YGZ0_9ACTN|nr:hypothetical protein Ade02nite_78930 [Actinoplanes deccanensis]